MGPLSGPRICSRMGEQIINHTWLKAAIKYNYIHFRIALWHEQRNNVHSD